MAFVGRERELARLAAGLERAAQGRTTRICLVGPAGIGVTRLLTELDGRLADLPGIVVCRGAAHEPWSGVAYRPLATALGGALGRLSDERLREVVGTAGYDLALLLPRLRERLAALDAVPDEPLLSAPDERASRLSEAVLGVLERLAGDGAVLLALEDLHWADPGTQRFVDTLLRISRQLPIALVVSYRPDELYRNHPTRELATALATHPEVETLGLEPLDRDELVRLMEGLAGERPSGGFVAAVVEGSAGIPLLAEQLVTAHETIEGLRLSDRFEEIIEARMEQLSVGAVRCLRLLAAARRAVPREMLLALELPEGRLSKQGLAEATDSGLCAVAGDELVILHERFAEAIEALGLPAERQATHAVLARALDTVPGEQAWHWEAAMRFAAARNSHVAAGEAAEALDPGGTALLHYQRALELAEASDPEVPGMGIPTSRLLARAAEASFVAGSFRRAVGLVQQAIAERSSATALGATSERGKAARRDLQLEVGLLYERLGRYRWASGDLVPALSALESAVQLVPDEPTPERARVLGALAQHLMLDGRFTESASLAERAAATARAAGPAAIATLGHATCTLGVDVAYGGDVDRGLALLEEAAAVARKAGRLDDLMRTYANRTTLLDLDSRREDAIAIVQEGVLEARRWGQEAVYGAFLRGNAADCLFNLGRWEESERECRAALEWSPSRLAWNPILFLGLVLVESRADEEASRIVGQILLQLESVPEGQWTAIVQRTAASFALWRDDLADAQRVAQRGWERVLQTDDWAQAAVAASTTLEVCAAVAESARGRRDWAAVALTGELGQKVLDEAGLRVRGSEMPQSLGARREAELHIGMARAHLARLRGRPDARVWGKLADGWAQVPLPYQAAKARWWEAAAALQARDDRIHARDALLESWRLAEQLSARPLQRELASLARRARIPLPGPVPEPLAPLSDAEHALDPLALTVVAMPTNGSTSRAPVPVMVPDDGDGGRRRSSVAITRALSERLAPAGVTPTRDPFGLSPRESEVLAVLSEGRTNREIAERLFISERTVGVHVRKILFKLGVSGRVEAASVAIRLGMVPGVERGVHRG